MTHCVFCDSAKLTDILDCETGKSAHSECWGRETEKGNHLKTACGQFRELLGRKIRFNPFTQTWGVYVEDNHYKYYITGMKYCLFCGEELVLA